jgi:hypothetical protein
MSDYAIVAADDVHRVGAGSAVRVAPRTPRSHRNESDEPVEMWAVSRHVERSDATKIETSGLPPPRQSSIATLMRDR